MYIKYPSDTMHTYSRGLVLVLVVVAGLLFMGEKRLLLLLPLGGCSVDSTTDLAMDPLPTLPTRDSLGGLLQQLNFTIGAELGVQRGDFAKRTLDHWVRAETYVLVDLWGHQEHYKDLANVDDAVQENFKREALDRLKEYEDALVVCRNYTSVCVEQFEDGYFDYIYVDARHDYTGVREDITLWWPKLKVGGIMAGHDYIDAEEVEKISGQDWSVSADGTKNPNGKAVKSAVDEWAAEHRQVLQITFRDAPWNTWVTRKTTSS